MSAIEQTEVETEKRRLTFQKSFSLEHAQQFKHRSLIDDAKLETASNVEFEKLEHLSMFTKSPSFTKSPTLSISEEGSQWPLQTEDIADDDIFWGKSKDEEIKTCNLVVGLKEGMQVLLKVLKEFESPSYKLHHVESRKCRDDEHNFEVFIQFDSTKSDLIALLNKLRRSSALSHVTLLPDSETESEVPKEHWFPKYIADLDDCVHLITKFEPELDTDHPGFCDQEYRKRRKEIADIAFCYKYGLPIPSTTYAPDEIDTWGRVYRKLVSLFPTHACKEHIEVFELLEKECGYSPDNIPQLETVSNFLKKRTGFQLRPVSGLLSARDFLASLAFRVFQCTQYVRHSSRPFHSPEPDCVHELLGHIPLLAVPSFAEFSQELGLASLGVSDEDIEKFSTLYWFTVEFGLCKQNGETRAIGAGLLSSFGELEHALSGVPEIKPFDPVTTAVQEYQDLTYQPIYFLAESFDSMKQKMRDYAQSINRPFEVSYDPFTQTITVLSNEQIISQTLEKLQKETGHLRRVIERMSLLSHDKIVETHSKVVNTT
ncbi:tyrosine 3-monooxygenase-like [Tubulanus polymorphus]|uniref:tyrosine 3-monooxygenase-like n=1 Tax=Tubulanus polymorphus TaxID=672921 RepID=UPI003DA5FB5E